MWPGTTGALPGVVRDTGTITRNGGDVDVLVCINADSADFYYDDATPVMYDYAAYPIALQCDPWEAFRSIDFADRNGDGQQRRGAAVRAGRCAGADGLVLG